MKSLWIACLLAVLLLSSAGLSGCASAQTENDSAESSEAEVQPEADPAAESSTADAGDPATGKVVDWKGAQITVTSARRFFSERGTASGTNHGDYVSVAFNVNNTNGSEAVSFDQSDVYLAEGQSPKVGDTIVPSAEVRHGQISNVNISGFQPPTYFKIGESGDVVIQWDIAKKDSIKPRSDIPDAANLTLVFVPIPADEAVQGTAPLSEYWASPLGLK